MDHYFDYWLFILYIEPFIQEMEESLQSTQFDKKKEEKIAKKREQQLKDRIHVSGFKKM